MKITIKTGGDWGGYIPDALRNGKLVIGIGDEIEITMQGDNLKELIALTDEAVQKLWGKCEKIVRVHDAQADMMRKFSEVIEQADMEAMSNQAISKKEFEKVMDAFYEFRNSYWNADIETGK